MIEEILKKKEESAPRGFSKSHSAGRRTHYRPIPLTAYIRSFTHNHENGKEKMMKRNEEDDATVISIDKQWRCTVVIQTAVSKK